MSISIFVVAQKQLTDEDFETVRLYNDLVARGYSPPDDMVLKLKHILASDLVLYDGEMITIPDGVKAIEVPISGEGDVMNHVKGEVISINKLPLNTIAIRIYAE